MAAYAFEVFGHLSTSRPSSFGGIAAIPVSEIFAYFDGMRLSNLDEREFLLSHIQVLDADFRKHYTPKDENPNKGKKDE